MLVFLSVCNYFYVCVLGYKVIFFKDEEIEERMEMKRTKSELTTRQTVIEIKIPRKAVGGIIGRQGSVIKEVR